MEPLTTAESDIARPQLKLDSELLENVSALLDSHQKGMVLNIIADLHPADISQLVAHIPFDEARLLFSWLPAEIAGDVLADLDDDFRAQLLGGASDARITAVLDELASDDVADILADLPDDVAERVLPELEDSEDVQALLTYEEDSAGGIMAREFVVVTQGSTIAEATEEVRRNAEDVEDLFVVFVVDAGERLLGYVTLKRLLLSPAGALIESVMFEDVVSVHTDTDQEDVARVMERYDLVSLPVVDENNRLVGRVTIDDVVDVIREEAEEDIQRLSGVAGGEEVTDSVFRVSRGRLPWLLAGLGGAGMAAAAVLHFEDALQTRTLLASFIPIVMATAGNAGIQSSAIAVQGLASGDIWASDISKRIGKELLVAMVNGLAVAVVLGLLIVGLGVLLPERFHSAERLALTAGLALMIVVVLATIIGATIPLLLDKFEIDPALATGPFITASNDILGIIVFFLLAEALYL